MTSLEYAITLCRSDLTHVVELGVWKGGTLKLLREKFPSEVLVIGFDSFKGLPEDWPNTGHKQGQFSTDGLAPAIPGTIIMPGWFYQSLPYYAHLAQPIALLHIDCDLYSSTIIALSMLNSWIVKGTILVCDEWLYEGRFDDQEQKAVYEWGLIYGRAWDGVPFEDRTPRGNERKILKVRG